MTFQPQHLARGELDSGVTAASQFERRDGNNFESRVVDYFENKGPKIQSSPLPKAVYVGRATLDWRRIRRPEEE